MKNILFITFLFWTNFVYSQQVYVKVLDLTTGNEKYVPYIAGITTVSGVSQKYVDSADNFLKTALNNKADKGTLINGNISFPYTIKLPENIFALNIQTDTYNTNYGSAGTMGQFHIGGYSNNRGVNADGRPDVVFMISGYNANPNNSRETNTDGAWDYSVETHYQISPNFVAKEFHMPRATDRRGIQHRLQSIYFDEANNLQTFAQFEMGSLVLNESTPDGLSSVTSWNVGHGQMDLIPAFTGQGATIRMWTPGQTKKAEIGFIGSGLIDFPDTGFGNSFHWDGTSGDLIIKGLKTYSDNAAAIAAGKKVNTLYQDVNGFIKIVK